PKRLRPIVEDDDLGLFSECRVELGEVSPLGRLGDGTDALRVPPDLSGMPARGDHPGAIEITILRSEKALDRSNDAQLVFVRITQISYVSVERKREARQEDEKDGRREPRRSMRNEAR